MSGEPQRDDDPEFLDDFIIEDAVAKEDDLDQLFAEPDAPAGAAGAGPAPATAPGEEDVLFEGPAPGLVPSETFTGGAEFREDAASAWQGEALDLDAPGVPVDGEAVAEGAPSAEVPEPSLPAELDALLQGEDEFSLEEDQELELAEGDGLLDGAAAEETFVIDDGAGTWQESAAEADTEVPVVADAASDAITTSDAPEQPELLAAAGLQDTAAPELEGETAGWEPLPGTSMDELAEVGEVAAADAMDGEVGSAEPEGAMAPLPVPAGLAPADHSEDEELYVAAAAAPAVVGGVPSTRRPFGLVLGFGVSTLAAAALVLVAVRPEWLGFEAAPPAVQVAQIPRPRVQVAVPTPPMPQVAVATPSVPPTPKEAVPPSEVPAPTLTQPPVAVEPSPPTTPSVPPVDQAPPATAPVATVPVEPPPPAAVPAPQWPVAAVTPPPAAAPGGSERLVRIADDLLVGAATSVPTPQVVEGMLPGSKAFAQLRNGNYFIGSVKSADGTRLLLRVEQGEVSLPVADLVKIAELGSADYDALQKATSGFVRLTNNNRLVGGILSGIADDHVVLEFRSNRVMLPKSAIGEVVQGDGDSSVRLQTTREEDDWLRELATRQLGQGAPRVDAKAAVPAPPAPQRPK